MNKNIANRGTNAYTALREKIRHFRLYLKLTQADLAKETGIGVRTLRNFESGVGCPRLLVRKALEAWAQTVEAGAQLARESLPPT